MCNRCNEEPETVGHWLKCPAAIMERQQHFEKDDLDLGILSRDPERSLAFAEAKATLLWDVPHNNNNNNNAELYADNVDKL